MCIEPLIIKSNLRDYNVSFNASNNFILELAKLKNSIFIIDSNVWSLYAKSDLQLLNSLDVIILKVGEELKSLATVQDLYDKIMHYAPKKNLNLVAIGGGILQDIVGFVASTLYRGVNWFFVPTTLLAQTDSCIGAKTSLNYNSYKNLIGTFYPPSAVYIYPKFLQTQEKSDFYSGVGEMAKLHIMGGEGNVKEFIRDREQIEKLNPDVLLERILCALLIKKDYIENDEFDQGRRNLLNYGHCFGHAIESSTNFAIPHGLAVVMGMILANIVACEKKLLSKELEYLMRTQILQPLLKIDLSKVHFICADIITAMTHDKKNTGAGLALVMCTDDYNMLKIDDVTIEYATDVFNRSREVFQ